MSDATIGSRARRMPGYVILTLVTGALLLVFVAPLLATLARSLTEPSLGFGNFERLATSRAFRNILWNTFEISTVSALICVVIAFPLAFHLARLPRAAAALLLALILLPLCTTTVSRLYAWRLILGDEGLINGALIAYGLTARPLPLLFNRSAVILGTVHTLLPYAILVLYSTVRGLDPSVVEAARSLGATPLQRFRRIVWPLTVRGIYAAFLVTFIQALGYYLTPALLGGASDITVATFIEEKISRADWGVASAMAVVIVAATLALFALLARVFPLETALSGGTRR